MKNTVWISHNKFTIAVKLALFLLPIATAIICLCIGRMNLSIIEVMNTLSDAAKGIRQSQNYSIVVNLRAPRILMAIILGAGLTCAGNAFQSLFSNPLATPDVLGVTSGACVGAIIAIIMSMGFMETQLLALAFGLLLCGLLWCSQKIAMGSP